MPDAIAIRNLEFDVPEKRILHDVNLDVARGEIVAIMGMSGSGKTTLLKCIGGLVRPTAGHILIEGQDIVGMRESELNHVRLKMGMVFQYAALFDSLDV